MINSFAVKHKQSISRITTQPGCIIRVKHRQAKFHIALQTPTWFCCSKTSNACLSAVRGDLWPPEAVNASETTSMQWQYCCYCC